MYALCFISRLFITFMLRLYRADVNCFVSVVSKKICLSNVNLV